MKKTALLTAFSILAVVNLTYSQTNQINSTGPVGIGTGSPQVQLHVVGDTRLNGTTTIFQNQKLRFFSETEGPYLTEYIGIRAYPQVSQHAFQVLDQPLYVGYQADQQDLDSQDGSVLVSNKLGIGTRFPSRRLAIHGPASSSLVDFGLYQNGTERAVFAIAGATNDIFTGTSAGDLAIRSTTGLLHIGSNNGSSAPAASFLQNGNVGIGTTAPSTKFHTNGTLRFQGLSNNNVLDRLLVTDANGNVSYRDVSSVAGSAGWSYEGNTVSALKKLGTVDPFDLPIITNNVERMRVLSDGTVIVGATTRPSLAGTGTLLAVNGQVFAAKVKVAVQGGWADYVFDDNYKLRPIKELESFIQRYHHLPEVPTTADVSREGVDVGDTQVLLLKKVEELTLYLIEQNKRIDAQQREIEGLKKQIQRRDQ
jgi:hypothetical protein